MPSVPGSHLVHFYGSTEGLATSLCSFFAEPLLRGETVMIVASPDHQKAIADALQAAGVELAADARAGRYLALDLDETLASMMTDGAPNPERFRSGPRAMVLDARRRTGAVHIYGEMIGTLLSRGDVVSAMRMEQLWHEFVAEHPLRLLCGYPRDLLDGDLAAVLDGVASIHDAMLWTREARARAEQATFDFPLEAGTTQAARAAARQVLAGWGIEDDERLTDADLVVSELLAAATRSGSAEATVSLTLVGGHAVVTVTSEPGVEPLAGDEGLTAVGLSYRLLAAITDGCGMRPAGSGTSAWARLRAPGAGSTSGPQQNSNARTSSSAR